VTERESDLPEIKHALTARLESLAESQLGAPVQRGRTWRWGSKGSLAVVMVGAKRGSWRDHEAMTGGGPLDLIMLGQGCALAPAITWARQWLGMTVEELRRTLPAPRAIEMDEQAVAERAVAERAAGIARARRLADSSVPVADTLAEFYLTAARSIPRRPWPACVRWRAATRALLLVATDADGACQAVQSVLLNDAGDKISGRLAKMSTGPQDGACVRLPCCAALAGPDGADVLVLAEGPETGLTAWACSGYETRITLGSMARAALPAGRRVVVCRDDDPLFVLDRRTGEGRPHPATMLLDRVMGEWRDAGHRVVGVLPWRVRRHDKSDLNDVLREHGGEAVRSRIARALRALDIVSERAAEQALSDKTIWGWHADPIVRRAMRGGLKSEADGVLP
jgi:putative DNA primase/helicase